jgi:hypothetical protein
MSNKSSATIATIGIDLGKNSFHVVELDQRGAIVLRHKWSRGQIEARLANSHSLFAFSDTDQMTSASGVAGPALFAALTEPA